MNERKKLGKWGEDLACDFLVKKGYKVIGRNFYCQDGEVDVIAQKGSELWFIEVKTRRSTFCGEGEECVDWVKEGKMESAALKYLEDKVIDPASWQLGIISIKILSKGRVTIRFLII